MTAYWSQANFELEEAIRNLSEKAFTALEAQKSSGVVRVSVRCTPIDLLSHLSTETFPQKVYWSSRDCGFEAIGLGVADTVTPDKARNPFEALESRLASSPSRQERPPLRYYGGIAFPNAGGGTTNTDHWRSFGAFRWVLPRFELMNGVDGSYMTCNIVVGDQAVDFDALRQEFRSLTRLITEDPRAPRFPRLLQREDLPNFAHWSQAIEHVLSSIQGARIQKTVLARQSHCRFEHELDSGWLFRQLKGTTPGCFHYFFSFSEGAAFLGASPERLYHRQDQRISTEAIAGTRPRGRSKDLDEALATELLLSQKDLREHQWVKDWISARLKPLCSDLKTLNENMLFKLSRIQHLRTQYEGELDSEVSDARIIQTLHPTPAVGGYPQEKSVELIAELEGFERGWYAGCVGWIGRESSEFAVGIRSALVQGSSLHLFAGAGIVEGSDPAKEWEELNHKMSDYLKVLNLV